ncbi:carbamoyltransferase C-terminal domain-containing protein [Chloroflexota bacterium]
MAELFLPANRTATRIIPAILHIDGTACVQTVNEQNKDLYELVNIFYKRTQVPILCNTSLNDRGEPIINNIAESLNFALRKGMRIVYINHKRVELIHHAEFSSKQVEPR